MFGELLGKYVNKKRLDNELSYEAVAKKSNIAESTVKNICTLKTDNPSMATAIPLVEAVGGSFDEMLHPEKNKDEVKEAAVLALKDVYEFQIASMKETNETHIANIRSHYEQHRQDYMENVEKRLADKLELIKAKNEHIKTLNKACLILGLSLGVCVLILVTLLIAEVMNPNLGWFRY